MAQFFSSLHALEEPDFKIFLFRSNFSPVNILSLRGEVYMHLRVPEGSRELVEKTDHELLPRCRGWKHQQFKYFFTFGESGGVLLHESFEKILFPIQQLLVWNRILLIIFWMHSVKFAWKKELLFNWFVDQFPIRCLKCGKNSRRTHQPKRTPHGFSKTQIHFGF